MMRKTWRIIIQEKASRHRVETIQFDVEQKIILIKQSFSRNGGLIKTMRNSY